MAVCPEGAFRLENLIPEDCHTGMAYMEPALPGFDLGSYRAGYVNYAAGQWPDLKKELELPKIISATVY